jgi:hypothetical protein
MSTDEQTPDVPQVSHESAAQKQERAEESAKVLTELLDLACSCLNDPDPQARAGAERDAKALAHAIKTLRGDSDA